MSKKKIFWRHDFKVLKNGLCLIELSKNERDFQKVERKAIEKEKNKTLH